MAKLKSTLTKAYYNPLSAVGEGIDPYSQEGIKAQIDSINQHYSPLIEQKKSTLGRTLAGALFGPIGMLAANRAAKRNDLLDRATYIEAQKNALGGVYDQAEKQSKLFSGLNFAKNNLRSYYKSQGLTDEEADANINGLFKGVSGLTFEQGQGTSSGVIGNNMYTQNQDTYANRIRNGMNLGFQGFNAANNAMPQLKTPQVNIAPAPTASPDTPQPTVTNSAPIGLSSTGKTAGGVPLYNAEKAGFANLLFSRAGQYDRKNGGTFMGQGGLGLLNAINGTDLGFKPQISAGYANFGHSNGKGGEHVGGNVVDIGLAGTTPQQQQALQALIQKQPGLAKLLHEDPNGANNHFHVVMTGQGPQVVDNATAQQAATQGMTVVPVQQYLAQMGNVDPLGYTAAPTPTITPYYVDNAVSQKIYDTNTNGVLQGFQKSDAFLKLPAELQKAFADAINTTATANKSATETMLLPGKTAADNAEKQASAEQKTASIRQKDRELDQDDERIANAKQVTAIARDRANLAVKAYESSQTIQTQQLALKELTQASTAAQSLVDSYEEVDANGKYTGKPKKGYEEDWKNAVAQKSEVNLKLMEMAGIGGKDKEKKPKPEEPAKITLPSGKEAKPTF